MAEGTVQAPQKSASRVSERAARRWYDWWFQRFDRGVVEASPERGMRPPIMNIGYWGTGATTSREAQEAFVELLASRITDRKGVRVLDAGSGLGGPAVLLAAEYGALVDGVNVNPTQVEV